MRCSEAGHGTGLSDADAVGPPVINSLIAGTCLSIEPHMPPPDLRKRDPRRVRVGRSTQNRMRRGVVRKLRISLDVKWHVHDGSPVISSPVLHIIYPSGHQDESTIDYSDELKLRCNRAEFTNHTLFI